MESGWRQIGASRCVDETGKTLRRSVNLANDVGDARIGDAPHRRAERRECSVRGQGPGEEPRATVAQIAFMDARMIVAQGIQIEKSHRTAGAQMMTRAGRDERHAELRVVAALQRQAERPGHRHRNGRGRVAVRREVPPGPRPGFFVRTSRGGTKAVVSS